MSMNQDTFVRAHLNLGFEPSVPEGVNSLPELVAFNAKHNPNHIFGLQLRTGDTPQARHISFSELSLAVDRAAGWLVTSGVTTGRSLRSDRVAPVAILLGSDIGIFIYMCALLRIGTPVLLLSARLTPVAIVHLLKATSPSTVLTSSHVARSVKETIALLEGLSSKPSFVRALTAEDFLDCTHVELQDLPIPPIYREFHYNDRDAFVMHSSGTTGLPKPIYHAQVYGLIYAACHRLPEEKSPYHWNASTLPLYHGFGLLAPCLALSIGLPFILPAAGTIPTARSTLAQLTSFDVRSLLTVPSIIEDIVGEGESGINALRRLDFVAVGGAAMASKVAEKLVSHGIKLLNHWGATEIGAIAPIELPPEGYDVHYLKPREDIGLVFHPVDETGRNFQLIAHPAGWDEDFIVQDLLERNPRDASQYKILGRVDDLIVLGTGEKVRPTGVETVVAEHPNVRAALAFGDGMASLGLIVELACVDSGMPRGDVLASLDPYLERGNAVMDKHAKISRDMLILTYADTRPLQRTDKGSLSRKAIFTAFDDEIKDAYIRAERVEAIPLPRDDHLALRRTLHDIVSKALSLDSLEELDDSADFFEAGMDSLQATRIRQTLSSSLRVTTGLAHPVTDLQRDFVFQNPSVNSLLAAVQNVMDGQDGASTQDREAARLEAMRAAVKRHATQLESFTDDALDARSARAQTTPKDRDDRIVLLTGASGSLGCQLLGRLAADPAVGKVICLNRGGIAARQRQMDAMKERCVELEEEVWREKVTVIGCDTSKPYFGIPAEKYDELLAVTHIVHNAWPVNFDRTLGSFESSIKTLDNLVQLALLSAVRNAHDDRPRRILFASSIAVAGRYPIINPDDRVVPEAPLDPRATAEFGYPEAKWVCEQVALEANRLFGSGEQPLIQASSVRIGQMTGAEGSGAWNASEHFPIIVATCQKLQAVPEISGTLSWMPVNRAAGVVADCLFTQDFAPIYHLENPARQEWSTTLQDLSQLLGGIPAVSFAEWLERVRALGADPQQNPAAKVIEFLERDFLRMASGTLVLDTEKTRVASPVLACSDSVSKRHLEEYVFYWKKVGAIKA